MLIIDEPCVDVCETRVVSELDEDVDVIVDGKEDCLGPAVPDDVDEEAVVGVDVIPDETSNRRARLTNLTRFARLIW